MIGIISLATGVLAGRHIPRKSALDFPMIEHSTRPQRSPEIVGKIESIVGNQITIAKLEQQNLDREEMSREERREFLDKLTPTERIAAMEARLNAFTGEDIVVEIPAGIEITRRTRPPQDKDGVRNLVSTQNLPAADDTTISSTELAEGDYVAIWLNGKISDQNIAEFINLIFTEPIDGIPQ